MNPLFTFDLEDSSGQYKSNGRFVQNTLRYLDFLAEIGVVGTFFSVGKVAEAAPKLLREIASRGHEIASHSLEHTQLHLQNEQQFYKSEREAKDILEQSADTAVQGFRAPVFSLIRQTTWALDILKDLKYVYSSSTIPCRNPLNGFPDIPITPFAWPNGLIEFPCPIFKFGPAAIPYLGGIYLRYIPIQFIHRLMKQQRQQLLWTYLHPYDIDAEEPYFRMPGTTPLVSLLLWMKRTHTLKKLAGILPHNSKTRFVDLASSDTFCTALPQLHQ